MRFSILAVAALSICFSDLAWAVPDGRSVIPADSSSFVLQGDQVNLGKLSISAVEGEPFSTAFRITTQPGASDEWNVQVCANTTSDVKAGDVLMAHFWLRCLDSMTGEGFTSFEFEQNHPEFEKACQFRISSGSQWTEIWVPFEANRDYPVGKTRIALWAGFDRQTVEIGGLTVVDFDKSVELKSLPRTKITYSGREPDAQWRKDALDRIERIRKGDFSVLVTDSAGAPLPNATIHVELKRHAFGFGTCVDVDGILGTSSDDERYRQTILQLFNHAVFENEMKWQATWDGVSPRVDQTLAWLRDHDITVRGHNLVWPSWRWLPRQLRAYESKPLLLGDQTDEHIRTMVGHFRGELTDWDVVNEVYANHDLIDLLGGKSVMVHWFGIAQAADPTARLCINDYGILDGGRVNAHRDSYFNTIKYLLDHGAPLEGIGIQSHFGSDLPPPTQVLAIFDRFAKFGLPIESTEISFDLGDAQLQADYLRDYTIAVFSHPAVTDMLLWGFWEKRHWRPRAALYNADWSIRPNGQAWLDLMKQWKTEADVTTDANGIANFRGFYGTYDVTVGNASRKVTEREQFLKGVEQQTVRLQ